MQEVIPLYAVTLKILLAGLSAEAAATIQQAEPPERFTLDFTVTDKLTNGQAARKFDAVIFSETALKDLSLMAFCQEQEDNTACILVTPQPQNLDKDVLSLLKEIWPSPLTANLAEKGQGCLAALQLLADHH